MIPYKTQPREKQLVALERSGGHDAFAYFMEMRTGKTKVTLDDAARAALDNKIDTLIVLAPNGVHRQWVEEELPKHMCLPTISTFYSAGAKVAHKRQFDKIIKAKTDDLKVITFNIESASNDTGKKLINQLVRSNRAMLATDESDMIKTPSAKRTRFMIDVAKHAEMRRALTGTPITQTPLDLYAQYKFLDPRILGYKNFAAFRSRYAELQTSNDKRAYYIARRRLSFMSLKQLNHMYNKAVPQEMWRRFLTTDDAIEAILTACPDSAVPPMIKVDSEGRKLYKNMSELEAKIAPHCYRLKASECNDLPALVNVPLYVELTKEQERIYNEMMEKALAYLEEPPIQTSDPLQWYLNADKLEASNALTKFLRAQQVLGGHVSDSEGNLRYIKHNRLKALMDFLPQVLGKAIIWAKFRPEIEEIKNVLIEQYGKDAVVEFHGGVDEDTRNANKKAFQQDARVQWLVGHAKAGGVGHTFDAADTVIFYSNDFSARTRWQAEVRASAVGKESIAVVDIIAPETIDAKIQKALEFCRQQAEEFNYG